MYLMDDYFSLSDMKNNNITSKDMIIKNAILECMRFNNIKDLIALIKQYGTNCPNDALGWSYLHYAAFNNVPLIAKELIKSGINVNSLNTDGETPLFTAIQNESLQMVEFLIKKNANLFIKNTYGFTPLEYAKVRILFEKDKQLLNIKTEIINILTEAINKKLKNKQFETIKNGLSR